MEKNARRLEAKFDDNNEERGIEKPDRFMRWQPTDEQCMVTDEELARRLVEEGEATSELMEKDAIGVAEFKSAIERSVAAAFDRVVVMRRELAVKAGIPTADNRVQ